MKPSFTNLRKEILDLIASQEKPLNAKSILGTMRSKPNLSTVYRALDYLVSHNFINTIAMGKTQCYYAHHEGTHGHFLHCNKCDHIIEFDECTVEDLATHLQQRFGFTITSHALYFEGFCTHCKEDIGGIVKEQ